jgi:hypothetical protein
MPDDASGLKIDEKNHVNEATLELLQRRIESNVRNNFLKTVTIPIGGGGVAAIFVAVFLWIPKQVESFLKQPSVETAVSTQIEAHINSYFAAAENKREMQRKIESVTAEQIKAEVNSRLPADVAKAVDNSVQEYFSTGEGRQFVAATVAKTAELYFSNARGQEQIQQLVDNYMKTTGKELLLNRLDETLRPAVARVSATIDTNRTRLVREFEHQSLHGEPKASIGKLQEYLSKKNVERLVKQGDPIVLTKTIRKGNSYEESVILDYLKGFRTEFGVQFSSVAVSYRGPEDSGDDLLALIPEQQFETVLNRKPEQVAAVLNSPDSSKQEARRKLEELFGTGVTRRIPSNRELAKVLQDGQIWGHIDVPNYDVPGTDTVKTFLPGLDTEFAVVDDLGKLLATTTRRRLIAGLLVTSTEGL